MNTALPEFSDDPATLLAADWPALSFASQRAEMAALIERHCPTPGKRQTAISDLVLFRGCTTDQPSCTIVRSVFAMIAQGAKRVLVGNETYDYDIRRYMVATVDLPMSSHVTIASQSEPYFGLALALDPLLVAELAAGVKPVAAGATPARGFGTARLNSAIQGASLRLLRLLDTPEHIPVLAPLIQRELLFHLLTGELGARLQQMVMAGNHGHQIARAIDFLKCNLASAVSIEHLADLANMSRSSLHQHFKALTSMTPVQYQKQLRLHEARRLMWLEQHDAASAAHRVGYESPSQFSREYRRLFGAPPARDVASLRANQQT